MARGGRRGNPYRDASGRFASGPGQGGGLGAARKAARSTSGRKGTLQARTSLKTSRAKLRAKDPADQRLSTALSTRAQKGAVTRGNRKLSAAKQSAQTRLQSPSRAGTIAKGAGKRNAINKATVLPSRVPAAQRPGSMTSVLGNTMRALAQADARRIREIEAITGQKVRAPRKPPAGAGATARPPGRRSVSGTLGDNLKKLAQSDARMMRGMAEIARDATPKIGRGKKGAIKAAPKALPPGGGVEKLKPPSRAKGSRTRLPKIAGVVGKPKGLKLGALAERRAAKAAKAQKLIGTKQPARTKKAKSQTQIVDQANRMLDKLKLRQITDATSNRYNLEKRIANVNKITKNIVPNYRHNPMRKGSSAKSAYKERNKKYGKGATAIRNMARDTEFFRYGRYL